MEKSLWLGRLPGSCREGSFWAGEPCGSWDEMQAQEEDIHERIFSGKQNKQKKKTRGFRKTWPGLAGRVPPPTWLVLAHLPEHRVHPTAAHTAFPTCGRSLRRRRGAVCVSYVSLQLQESSRSRAYSEHGRKEKGKKKEKNFPILTFWCRKIVGNT